MRYARAVAATFLVPVFAFLAAACGGTAVQGPPESDDGTDQTAPAEESTSTGGSTSSGPVEVNTTTIATDLEAPWDLVFTPDGNALVTERDSGRLSSVDLSGNVEELLRIQPDGSVPSDNPFPNSPVYSYGHRNVQGLAWDEGGQLYASEFGQNRYAEVNRIEAGGNYGWPEVEGTGGGPDYIDPITTFATSEASPSGATFLKTGAIPQWEGDFFTASLKGQRLRRLEIDGSGNVAEKEPLLQNEDGRLRQVVQAPDGSLWVLTSNRDGRGNPTSDDDRILRLAPAGT